MLFHKSYISRLLKVFLACGIVNRKRSLIGAFKSSWAVLWARPRLLVLMNVVFFGGLLVSTLAMGTLFPPTPYANLHPDIPDYFLGLSWPLMVLAIFLSNLALSAFVVVSLPGFVFFPASACLLGYRAFLWGLLFGPLPTYTFLAALPIIFLEGEAYVLAATAGTTVGVSWLKPAWLQSARLHTSEAPSRCDAFRRALKECSEIYVLVILLLFVAAAVETATIIAGY